METRGHDMAVLSRQLFIVSTLLLATGCAARSVPGSSAMTRTELYLGLATRSSQVSDREFQAFLDTSVTPRFPAGYTVVSAEGRWGEKNRTIKESSRVLIFLHQNTESDNAKLELIRREYKTQFDQDAVLRVDSAARAAF